MVGMVYWDQWDVVEMTVKWEIKAPKESLEKTENPD